MLTLQSLTKRFANFQLHDVNLQLQAHEYFVLLGPSGVGKTVILELIAGLLRPDAGRVCWDNTDITDWAPERRRFGLVYQDYALFPHLNVLQNVVYGLRAHGVARKPALARAEHMLGLVGIAALAQRWPGTLSGGEQQRVALARALAVEPHLVLLDEPLAALDPNVRRELRQVLRQLQRQTGATFLHVTHDLEEALALGQRVAVMLDGRIRQVGPADALFLRPTDPEVATFLGLRNVLAIDQATPAGCMVGDVVITHAAGPTTASHVWIRPEEIQLSRAPFHEPHPNQFQARVIGWEPTSTLAAVHVAIAGVPVTALVSHAKRSELALQPGESIHCRFGSAAVHLFGQRR